MSEPLLYMWLIPVLPLVASILTAFLGPTVLRRQSHWPCILGAIGSCVVSLVLFWAVLHQDISSGSPVPWPAYYPWFHAGTVDVGFTLRADALSAFMAVTVTFIGSFIAIYSVGYMSHEREHNDGYARYFAEVALFIFSMTGLVLADNFLVLYAFWEGVGLCSYLLIGFWFTKPSAAAAARKAFLVTRIGDLGFILGIILLWSGFGLRVSFPEEKFVPLHALDYETVFAALGQANFEGPVTAVCLLLFCGAVGKSAQFPLHVWLPDAMEGPSPVSALIHAATMVTAGVYLVARCTPLFALSLNAQVVVALIGAVTALLAALIALTQTDLKRVLAYSTISQLGYMFMALGSGAVVAAMFHLFTHAFFKALLFLAAGSVMHAMGNVIDMRRFSGLKRVLPVTHATFLCGAAALAGVPFITSGFWSKDEILGGIFRAGQDPNRRDFSSVYILIFVLALITAGLTAFYTFRAYFLTFWGEERIPHEAGHHAHESPRVMTVPLIVLAAGALLAGFINAEPLTRGLHHFLGDIPPPANILPLEAATEAGMPRETPWLWLGSVIFATGGIGLAWWMYVKQPGFADRLATGIQGLYQWSLNKFHIDELYDALIVKPLEGFAHFCRIIDLSVVDSLVDVLGQVPRVLGIILRPIQNGLVQFYALAMVLALAVFLIALVHVLAG